MVTNVGTVLVPPVDSIVGDGVVPALVVTAVVALRVMSSSFELGLRGASNTATSTRPRPRRPSLAFHCVPVFRVR
jgi:hypothetical protein